MPLAISSRALARIKKFELPARAVGVIIAYAAWIGVFRLLVLTFVTYFVMSSSNHSSKFEDVYEAFGSNELGIIGMGALIFVLIFPRLNPIRAPLGQEYFSPARFERQFLPGFAQGAVLAAALVLSFVMAGVYRYLGFFVQFEETPLAIINVILRTLSLASLVYFEEFLFRKKILEILLRWRPAGTRSNEWLVATTISILYCLIKGLQFDLGLMHWVTLFLLSLSLTFRAIKRGFDEGAGFLVALLIIFHPLLSLPILGNEISGLLLIKYQPGGIELPANALDQANSTVRLFSGGSGGPLSSLALQLLLFLGIIRESIWRASILTTKNQ